MSGEVGLAEQTETKMELDRYMRHGLSPRRRREEGREGKTLGDLYHVKEKRGQGHWSRTR